MEAESVYEDESEEGLSLNWRCCRVLSGSKSIGSQYAPPLFGLHADTHLYNRCRRQELGIGQQDHNLA